MKKFFLLIPAIFVITFFSGCIPSKPAEEVEILPSERLLKKLEVNRRKIKELEGVGSISVKSPDINTSASFKVIFQKPDSVYLEIYGPFGIDLAQVLITSNDFSFYDIIHNINYRGRTNSDVLNKIFKVNISFNDLVDAFIGSVNLSSKLSKEPDKYEVIYNKYILTYNDPAQQLVSKFTVDVRELALTDYQLLNNDEELLIDGRYSKFKLMENIPVPFETEFKNELQSQGIKIEYRKINLNKGRQKLSIAIPEDAEIIDL